MIDHQSSNEIIVVCIKRSKEPKEGVLIRKVLEKW